MTMGLGDSACCVRWTLLEICPDLRAHHLEKHGNLRSTSSCIAKAIRDTPEADPQRESQNLVPIGKKAARVPHVPTERPNLCYDRHSGHPMSAVVTKQPRYHRNAYSSKTSEGRILAKQIDCILNHFSRVKCFLCTSVVHVGHKLPTLTISNH